MSNRPVRPTLTRLHPPCTSRRLRPDRPFGMEQLAARTSELSRCTAPRSLSLPRPRTTTAAPRRTMFKDLTITSSSHSRNNNNSSHVRSGLRFEATVLRPVLSMHWTMKPPNFVSPYRRYFPPKRWTR